MNSRDVYIRELDKSKLVGHEYYFPSFRLLSEFVGRCTPYASNAYRKHHGLLHSLKDRKTYLITKVGGRNVIDTEWLASKKKLSADQADHIRKLSKQEKKARLSQIYVKLHALEEKYPKGLAGSEGTDELKELQELVR